LVCDRPSLIKDFISEARVVQMGWKDAADFDSTISALDKAFFNLIISNINSSGPSYYPSQYVPMISKRVGLTFCLEAAHKHGIEVHV
jgi:hypothetical protein